jgi:chorismate synthase
VTWTYDPLLIRNARLNLVRLKARAVAYLPDVYGRLGGLYGPLPTDRFEVHWRLDSREVEQAALGRASEPDDAGSIPEATADRPSRSASRLAVAVPLEASPETSGEPDARRSAQRRLRKLAPGLFDRGYEAVSLAVLADRAIYVFQRSGRLQ